MFLKVKELREAFGHIHHRTEFTSTALPLSLLGRWPLSPMVDTRMNGELFTQQHTSGQG